MDEDQILKHEGMLTSTLEIIKQSIYVILYLETITKLCMYEDLIRERISKYSIYKSVGGIVIMFRPVVHKIMQCCF